MLLQRINRSDAEKVFISIYNVEGATITAGLPVSLVNTSTDGVNAVVANATADYPGFAGVATRDIPANQYGLIQVAGWIDSVRLSNYGTSVTVNANNPLVPAAGGFASAAPTYANSGNRFVFAQDVPVAVSAVGYCSGLIRMI